jgi:hypothetical protein
MILKIFSPFLGENTDSFFLQKMKIGLPTCKKNENFVAKSCRKFFDHNNDPWKVAEMSRHVHTYIFKKLLPYVPIPWLDSISRPIAPVSSVAGGDH